MSHLISFKLYVQYFRFLVDPEFSLTCDQSRITRVHYLPDMFMRAVYTVQICIFIFIYQEVSKQRRTSAQMHFGIYASKTPPWVR